MTVYLLPNGKQQFIDINGKPLVSGTVGMYIVNTLTPKNTWQDPDKNALNSNPVVLDSRGQASIYGSGTYRQIVKDSLGNTIWDEVIENVYTGITDDGGLLITGTVGTNTENVRSDAQIGLVSASKTLVNPIFTNPTGEAAWTPYSLDSNNANVQISSFFAGFVGGSNTAGTWRGFQAIHMPSGNADDIVPMFWQSNGAIVCGAGATSGLPWNTLGTANWMDVRSDGLLVRNACAIGSNHGFSVASGFALEVSGFGQFGDVLTGAIDHSLQVGYSSGGSTAFVQAYRNSTAAFIPLALGASQITIPNGLTNAANDAAAAAAGVPVTGLYRNGSVVMIRVT